MQSETVVAVYRNVAEAESAIAELERGGVPRSAIHHHTKSTTSTDYSTAAQTSGTVSDPTTGLRRERGGFWSWLLGDEDTEEARSHYQSLDRSIDRGDVVVSVICSSANVDQVVRILESTNPVKIDEHESTVGTGTSTAGLSSAASTTASTAATTPTATTSTVANQGTVASSLTDTTRAGLSETGRSAETIPVHEEQLDVGKRQVSGTATIRRYVTQRPVEEQVRLRDETIRIERRPVDRDVTAAEDAFTEKRIDITETTERPVVEKTARVVEEVVVNKDVNERVETVRDTVRKEDVEVTRDDNKDRGIGAQSADTGTTTSRTAGVTGATGPATREGETFGERHPNLAHPIETVEDKAAGRPTPAEREGKA